MVRRFYYGDARGMGNKVTGIRTGDDWIINHVAKTVYTVRGFYDKPGAYVGIVRKHGGKWYAKHDRAPEQVMECKTLTAAIEHLMRRDAIV